MKEILVLGPGCFKCQKLHENVLKAKEESGIECEVFKVTEPAAIAGFGVMSSPALMVDGELKSAGKLLTVEQIKQIISE